MRYHFEKPELYSSLYGETYICNHPVYSRCTLYRIGEKGLAVIQQRFNKDEKTTRWSEIDPWLTDAIYLAAGFKGYFDRTAGKAENGLYPTVAVRKIMWALKMKPIPKEQWETVFDRGTV